LSSLLLAACRLLLHPWAGLLTSSPEAPVVDGKEGQ